jgi:hypothetical protein
VALVMTYTRFQQRTLLLGVAALLSGLVLVRLLKGHPRPAMGRSRRAVDVVPGVAREAASAAVTRPDGAVAEPVSGRGEEVAVLSGAPRPSTPSAPEDHPGNEREERLVEGA